MRFNLIAVGTLMGILALGACSSATEEKKAGQANSNSNAAVVAAANANTVTLANGTEVLPPQPVDANVNQVGAAGSDTLVSTRDGVDTKLEQIRKSGEGRPLDAATIAKQNTRPAPENSTFTSYLTDAGYEIRTFKNHPQLAKVEKKIASDGKQTARIFLRNGKVVDVPGERVSPLSTASAEFLLQQAGVQLQPASPAPAGPAPTKKSGE